MLRRISFLALIAFALPTAVRAAEDEPAGTIAHIKLSGSLEEGSPAIDPLFGTASENFKAKIDRIKKAQKDAAVKGLYLQLDGLHVGLAKIDELSRAIADFKKSGKKVYAYLESGEHRLWVEGWAARSPAFADVLAALRNDHEERTQPDPDGVVVPLDRRR